MTTRRLPLVLLAFCACTDTYLHDERRDLDIPVDRSVSIIADVCAPTPLEGNRPIKILIAMDASQSMTISDPDNSRATAVLQLLRSLPAEREVEFAVMVFADTTTAWLTKSGQNEFEKVIDYDEGDLDILNQKIVRSGTSTTQRGATDFQKPISQLYQMINTDIFRGRGRAPARYSVIFLTDGHPTVNQDDVLLCDGDPPNLPKQVRRLREAADDVQFHTVHVFRPTQPIDSSKCNQPAPPPPSQADCRIRDLPSDSCPLLIINQNIERLQIMARYGGGTFRDFRNDEPINFLNYDLGRVRRGFSLTSVVASNLSSPAGSPESLADSDSDGLLDADEVRERTSPWVVDTDGDGFSDGVEVEMRTHGAPVRPTQADTGCPMEARNVDSDCDGLLDCDELLLGTNARAFDSDRDGIADPIEHQLGTNPASNDLDFDPDSDGVPHLLELQRHTDPSVSDSAISTRGGYRTEFTSLGMNEQGQQCWAVRIDNVLLANTLANPDPMAPAAQRLPGLNDLLFTATFRADDSPTSQPIVARFRTRDVRFPVGGIRSPPDGIIRVTNSQLSTSCTPGGLGN